MLITRLECINVRYRPVSILKIGTIHSSETSTSTYKLRVVTIQRNKSRLLIKELINLAVLKLILNSKNIAVVHNSETFNLLKPTGYVMHKQF